jgi:hypothetical protein
MRTRRRDCRATARILRNPERYDFDLSGPGVRADLSRPIRRASEMVHICDIFQIGLRAGGSARQEEVDAALAYGTNLITAHELHEVGAGAGAILARISGDRCYYVTIDMNGMDPSCAPGVLAPRSGGVTFAQAWSCYGVWSATAAWSVWTSWKSRRAPTPPASPPGSRSSTCSARRCARVGAIAGTNGWTQCSIKCERSHDPRGNVP